MIAGNRLRPNVPLSVVCRGRVQKIERKEKEKGGGRKEKTKKKTKKDNPSKSGAKSLEPNLVNRADGGKGRRCGGRGGASKPGLGELQA